MRQFTVVLQDRKGGPYRTQRLADASPMDLTLKLLERKQTVVAVLDSRKVPALAKKRNKPLDKVYFFEQLEAACSVGFDLARAMETAHISISGKTSSGKALKEITGEIGRKLQQGELLSSVAPRFPNLFNEVALGLIEAGEHSGSLSETFGSVRQLASRDEKLKDNLISICIYPAMFLAVAAVVVYQLATGPLPQLARVLEYLKGDLPWQSKLIVEIGKFIGTYPILYLAFIGGLVSFLACLPALIRRTRTLHKWVLKIPFIGLLILASIRASFVQTFAILKKAKVDNLSCLLLLKDISWCYPYRAALARSHRRVANGETLAIALEAESDIFGQRCVQYLRFLEETGASAAMLDRLAAVLNRDLDNTIQRAETIAKPLIILALGAVVALIAAAVYQPLIEMYNRI
jgi:type II secretory pathway component PulF